eukprot:TRINITY_DN347_c0_g1_i6.p1 TRINITY_DN347_c0_g1~~TRINITY_DN347_c0_g1_i6.p1  ORF type:complete len:338 (+),score=68.14 TRINITY_DN347_c0_g1_i6:1870-2883(+)
MTNSSLSIKTTLTHTIRGTHSGKRKAFCRSFSNQNQHHQMNNASEIDLSTEKLGEKSPKGEEKVNTWWASFKAWICRFLNLQAGVQPATPTANEPTNNDNVLLQDLPGAPEKPSHLSKETWEVILRFEELFKLLHEEDREVQRKSIKKLRQSIHALPTQLSVEFDTTDTKVLTTFRDMENIITRVDECLDFAVKGADQSIVTQKIQELGQEFSNILADCKVAIQEARQRCQAQKEEAEKKARADGLRGAGAVGVGLLGAGAAGAAGFLGAGAFGAGGLLGAALLGPIVAVVALPFAGYNLRTSADNSLKANDLAKKDKNLAALGEKIDELSKRKGTE